MTRRRFLAGIGTLGSIGLAQALPKQSALSLAGDSDASPYSPTSNPGDLYEVTRLTLTHGVANIDARRVSIEGGAAKYDGMRISLHAEVEDLKTLSFGSLVCVRTPDQLKRLGIPIANSNPSVRRARVDYKGQVLVAEKPLAVAGRCIAMWREAA